MTTPESLSIITANAERIGSLKERIRSMKILGSHILVCNYEKVHEEACDVCSWARDVMLQIGEDE